MAKKSSRKSARKPSAAAAIRKLLDQGLESPQEISKRLQVQGLNVTPAHVSTVKTAYKKTKSSKRDKGRSSENGVATRASEPSAARAASVGKAATAEQQELEFDPKSLVRVKKFADGLGGLHNLQYYLDILVAISAVR